MLRIGITQRVDVISHYSERRDALDQQWHHLLEVVGVMGIPLPNHAALAPDLFDALALDGLILSGGNDPGSAPERDAMELAALRWAEQQRKPVLGVCRGMQMINQYCGGSLQAVDQHAATRHALNGSGPLLAGLREVNSYHHYGIVDATLGTGLLVLARAPDDSIEALRHPTLPWFAVMWHPEREQPLRSHEVSLIQQIFGLECQQP